MSASEDAAVSAAHELLGVEATEVETPESSGSESEVTEVEFPSFEVELPPELLAELDAPAEEEFDASEQEIEDLMQEYPDENPEVLARLRKAEKQAQYFEQLRQQEARKNWKAEAAKFFPLAEPFLDEFNATSKRGFLRQAREVHSRMLPIVEERVLKPAREAVERGKAEGVQEAKEEARTAWGQPVTQNPPSDALVTQEVARERRRRGELSDYVRQMVFGNQQEEQ